MKRWEMLWLAFEKFAIFFSFTVVFIVVMAVAVVGLATWQALPTLQETASAVSSDVVCPLVADVNVLMDDLENAVITRTIPISQSIPVVFTLPVEKNLNVRLTEGVQLSRPTNFVLPAGGGQINGTVYLVLPKGQKLPVHMRMNVPVNEMLPVQMDVDVAIPLKETELGPVVDQLKDLLLPYMDLLDEKLKCSAQ
jgi:hypothetical protein